MSGCHLCITRNETVHPRYFQNRSIMFCYHYICERFIYFRGIEDQSVYFAAANYVDRSWEYINRSQTHECRKLGWDRAIPFPGIHKFNFSVQWGPTLETLPDGESYSTSPSAWLSILSPPAYSATLAHNSYLASHKKLFSPIFSAQNFNGDISSSLWLLNALWGTLSSPSGI